MCCSYYMQYIAKCHIDNSFSGKQLQKQFYDTKDVVSIKKEVLFLIKASPSSYCLFVKMQPLQYQRH